ncbi:hypothetical protein [Actinoallomurus iriomotensis]|uniref:Uncharacterized protein n=1 Tax=Actinoallomurus iriomotensis TaxID=478107 RepID=A0A9W6SDM0_9ACTN|nr:hypothetical protein [Actinoallomurus iriomotensis]GLY91663.1 hypothetical protein Airi02_095910 [Actinoallomurus iriomotensis]
MATARSSLSGGDSSYHWLGERLYSGDYQTRCEANGTRLVCRPSRTWLTARESG